MIKCNHSVPFLWHFRILFEMQRFPLIARHKWRVESRRIFLSVCKCPVKTVLTRIISIVRVPSLCFYKDTHSNYDDELQWPSLSVKLAVNSDRKDTVHKSWWTFTQPLLAVWGEVHRLSSSPSLKKVKAKHNWGETCKVIPAEKS